MRLFAIRCDRVFGGFALLGEREQPLAPAEVNHVSTLPRPSVS